MGLLLQPWIGDPGLLAENSLKYGAREIDSRNFCLSKSPSCSHCSYEIKLQNMWSVEILCEALSGCDFVLLSNVKLSSLIHNDRPRSFYREKASLFLRPSLATSQMSVVVCPVNWLYGCSLCGMAIIMSINPATGNEIWCIRGTEWFVPESLTMCVGHGIAVDTVKEPHMI